MVIPYKTLNDMKRDSIVTTVKGVPVSKFNNKDNKTENKNYNFFKSIVDGINYPVYIRDIQSGVYIYINDAVTNATGYLRAELVGKKPEEVYSSILADYYNQLDNELVQSNLSSLVIDEEIRKTRNNIIRIFKTTKNLIYNEETGNPQFIVDICEDITDKKISSEELENVDNIFARLIYSSPVAISIMSAKSNLILDVNQSFADLTENSREDIIGIKYYDSDFWLEPDVLKGYFEKTIYSGLLKNIDLKILSKSGKHRNILATFEFIPSYGTSESLVIMSSLDITERFQVEDEIRKTLEKEKELSMLKNRFISMISHEFRTPLTGIMLSTDLLRRYGDTWNNTEKQKHFDRIQHIVLTMTQLMENVLTIGKMESDNFDFHPDSVDIESFCKSVVDNVSYIAKDDINIMYNANGNATKLYVDENLLALVCTNLLTNAIKYSPKGSDIIFESYTNPREVVFVVKDYGIGIPRQDIEHLFKTFYRASNTGSIAGYGLGLSIVKKCVDAHNGTIMVDSEVNRGTTFTVRIPNTDVSAKQNGA